MQLLKLTPQRYSCMELVRKHTSIPVNVPSGALAYTLKIAHLERLVQDCDPSNYARVHKKLKCPVPGCKEKLTSINTYSCRSCSTDVCLKHRFPGDHACDARKGALLGLASSLSCILECCWQQRPTSLHMARWTDNLADQPVLLQRPSNSRQPVSCGVCWAWVPLKRRLPHRQLGRTPHRKSLLRCPLELARPLLQELQQRLQSGAGSPAVSLSRSAFFPCSSS